MYHCIITVESAISLYHCIITVDSAISVYHCIITVESAISVYYNSAMQCTVGKDRDIVFDKYPDMNVPEDTAAIVSRCHFADMFPKERIAL